jgi:hypothetical protein
MRSITIQREFKMKQSKKKPNGSNSLYIIKQFNLLKQFIIVNSIPFDTPMDKKVPKRFQKQSW